MFQEVTDEHRAFRKRELVSDLFLEGCAPTLKELMENVKVRYCEGCREEQSSQKEHECCFFAYMRHAAGWMTPVRDQYDLSIVLLVHNWEKVFATIKTLIGEPKYAGISLYDFLEFFTKPYEIEPFVRVITDYQWKKKLFRHVTGEELDPEEDDQEEEEKDSLPSDDEATRDSFN